MTLKDKLEIGLKENAPFRKDNLPESQVRGPEIPAGPGRSPEIPLAREDVTAPETSDATSADSPAAPQPKPTADGTSPQPPIEPESNGGG
jgi:hypothetical protein